MSKQADVHITRWLTALINCTAPWTINDLALLRKASTSVKYQFFRIFTDNLQSVQKQRFWGKGSSLPLKSGKFYRSITLDSPIAAFIFGLLVLLPKIIENLATSDGHWTRTGFVHPWIKSTAPWVFPTHHSCSQGHKADQDEEEHAPLVSNINSRHFAASSAIALNPQHMCRLLNPHDLQSSTAPTCSKCCNCTTTY